MHKHAQKNKLDTVHDLCELYEAMAQNMKANFFCLYKKNLTFLQCQFK